MEQVRREARRSWPEDELPAAGPVRVALTYLYSGIAVDLDNLVKPIVDALKGVAYLDDEQVTDILVRKRNLAENLRVEDPQSALAEGIARSKEFLHVVVQDAPDQEVLE